MKGQVTFEQVNRRFIPLQESSSGVHYNNSNNSFDHATVTNWTKRSGSLSPKSVSYTAPVAFAAVSTLSTLALIYMFTNNGDNKPKKSEGRSTPLPGYGILGDKVNEVIELFLDALAVYVHNDNKWDCQRRMLCEANQRAGDYGTVQGIVMYFLSLGVSLILNNQPVSQSLEAMQLGRHGNDCSNIYPKCPFSL